MFHHYQKNKQQQQIAPSPEIEIKDQQLEGTINLYDPVMWKHPILKN